MSKSIFKSNQCLNCDSPISLGILCSDCFQDDPVSDEQENTLKTVSEMTFSEIGYTTQDAFIEEIGNIWILRTAQVANQPNSFYNVRIKKSLTSIIEVDYTTLISDLVIQGELSSEDQKYYIMAVLTRMKS